MLPSFGFTPNGGCDSRAGCPVPGSAAPSRRVPDPRSASRPPPCPVAPGGTAGMNRCWKPRVRQASTTASGFSRRAAMLTWLEDAFRPRASSLDRMSAALSNASRPSRHSGSRLPPPYRGCGRRPPGYAGCRANMRVVRGAHGILRFEKGARAKRGLRVAWIVYDSRGARRSPMRTGRSCAASTPRPRGSPGAAFLFPLVLTWMGPSPSLHQITVSAPMGSTIRS